MNIAKFLLVTLFVCPTISLASNLTDLQMEVGLATQAESICLNTEPVSTLSMKICTGNLAATLDIILNREYKKVMNGFQNTDYDQEIKNRFRQSQRDWLSFRKSNCSWASSQMLGGTGEGLIYGGCENAMTEKRIMEIAEHFQTF